MFLSANLRRACFMAFPMLLLFFPVTVLAGWALVDNFETYNLGPIGGQGDWTAPGGGNSDNSVPLHFDDIHYDKTDGQLNLINPVPEPGSIGLALIAVAGFALLSRRRHSSSALHRFRIPGGGQLDRRRVIYRQMSHVGNMYKNRLIETRTVHAGIQDNFPTVAHRHVFGSDNFSCVPS